MDQQSVATSLAPEVIIEQVLGSLQVKGWEQPEVVIKANANELTLEEQDDTVRINCRGNCAIRLPKGATLTVQNVSGEARFKILEDQLTVETINGNLILRSVADANIETVGGEAQVKYIVGDLRIENVGGDLNARNIQGDCVAENVGGNTEIRYVEGDVIVSSGGNARLRLNQMDGQEYKVSAGGNIECRIPADVNLQVNATSAAETIKIRSEEELKKIQAESYDFTLGSGEIPMNLDAGGSIYFTASKSAGMETDEFDLNFGQEIGGISESMAKQIESQIEAQMESMTQKLNQQLENLTSRISASGLSDEQSERIMQKARDSSERAASRAEEKMRRAQEKLERKLEAARRKADLRAQAAERRAEARSKRSWGVQWPATPESQAEEPPTDEERLMILRMLEQKKISLEEAEELLDALEGRE